MHCLEQYRNRLVRDANRKLRVILESPDESAVHDFRVGIKRLTALYGFLGQADANLSAKKLMKPYRALFKSLGGIRDAHIAIGLIEGLEPSPEAESKRLVRLLNTRVRRDYRSFRNLAGNGRAITIRLPTIGATGISSAAITRHKSTYLEQLKTKIVTADRCLNVDGWHGKRILLKRYRHLIDAFSACPGHTADDRIMKRIALLEQLLGDWHDRVICVGIIESLSGPETDRKRLNSRLRTQAGQLLGSAKIYLPGLASRLDDG